MWVHLYVLSTSLQLVMRTAAGPAGRWAFLGMQFLHSNGEAAGGKGAWDVAQW